MKKDKDQFYTKPEIAKMCFDIAQDHIQKLGIKDPFYIEPSAGQGSFYDLMPEDQRLGLDIDPQHHEVIEQDFLTFNINTAPKNAVTIGNPPFGTVNKLTIQFINIASIFSDLIGFIVPSTFHRYFYTKQLTTELHLISRTKLPKDSFYRPNGKPYNIQCDFLIWSKRIGPFTDLREYKPGCTTHPDFEMIFLIGSKSPAFENKKVQIYQNQRFCFGTLVQGYVDSQHAGIIQKNLNLITPNMNWLLFYTNDQEVEQRLLNLDFKTLYQKYQFIHSGFGKADVIEAYNEKYKPKNKIEKQLGLF